MKILPARAALAISSTKPRGSSRTMSAASAWEKPRTASQLVLPTSGATTCSPFPPVVFTKLSSPRASSRTRTSRAASTVRAQGTAGSGSRSMTTRSGSSSREASEPQVWISRMPIWARAISASSESTTRYSPTLVRSRIFTRRSAGGAQVPVCFW